MPARLRLPQSSQVLLVLVYLVVAAAYVVWVPLFEAPDEQSHIHYVGFVASEGRPPRYVDRPEVPGEGMQPPLFYWLSAPIYWWVAPQEPELLAELRRASNSVYGYERYAISSNKLLRKAESRGPSQIFEVDPVLLPLRALRWPAVAAGLTALLLTMSAVRRMGGEARLALLAGSLLALSPQFLFVAASVSNESAAAAVGAAAFWIVAPVLGGRTARSRDYLWLGSLLALGHLTKLSSLPVVAVSGAVLLMMDRRDPGRRVRDVAGAAMIALIIAGPYLAWSFSNRGDLLGVTAVWQSAAEFRTPESLGGISAYLSGAYPELTFKSYWARFGWMNVPAPPGIMLIFALLSCIGAAGFVLSWWSLRDASEARFTTVCHRYLAASAAAMLASHVWLNLQIVQPQGRHLFSAAPQIACLLALGIARLTTDGRGSSPGALALGVSSVLLAVALYCLFAVIVPSYSLLAGQ